VKTGGEYENKNPVPQAFLQLAGPLAVNIQDDIAALSAKPVKGLHGGAVKIAMDLGPLSKLTGGNHLFKLGRRYEKIVAAIHFAGSGRSRSIAHRMPQVPRNVNDFLAERGFAGPGRG
jgi:hypothetical protein